MTKIALLPGDGIGSEILDGPVKYLRRLAASGVPLELSDPMPYGTSGWQQTGSILPPQTLAACDAADVIFSGAVGTHPGVPADECPTPEAALIELRHRFDLRISVRTVWVPGADDVTIIRNITGGAYADPSQRSESDGVCAATDQIQLFPIKVREVLEMAVDYANRVPNCRYISVDKASVFATSRLWRSTARKVSAESGVAFENVNVDRAAYELVKNHDLPAVIATEGIFGDILSDVVCARAGSPALCGSATINPDRPFGSGATALFEPAHGSSPHRTGSRRSNPAGSWLGLASMFEWCPDLQHLGVSMMIRRALSSLHDSGVRTYDLAADGDRVVDMDEFNDLMLAELSVAQSV